MAQTSPHITLPDYPNEIQADPRALHYTEEELLKMYSAMRLARVFEEKLAALYRQGKIFGAVYLGMGHEATSVGCASLLQKGDLFSTVARNLSAWFYRGVKPEHVMARWFGKNQEPSRGRELGLFLADMENYGIAPYHNGSMASWIPAGAGYALAFKLRKQPNIFLAFTGDGATSPGDFYEGLNFASIHKLPLVVICEVNQFAYSTPPEKQMPVRNVADRAPAFNIYAETAFGNDLFTVIEAARRGIEHARGGNGPALIEFKTFRQRGHGEHDDCSYVPAELRKFWEERDPIAMYRRWLVERAKVNRGMLARIDEVAARQVEAAVEYAQSLPYPKPESVTERLFAASPHDTKPEDRTNIYEPIEHPAIPSLMAAQDRSSGEHF
ncbi:MAG TPA: thiamine pyrophosphate-dependent dehydrogenase E1 component subunit alpha [Blastocatellia bacterium]|nr:thiamine pyrophosphate-dependent dehydrogenase E1 component subunit alpha [Blastocatellia bacterium]